MKDFKEKQEYFLLQIDKTQHLSFAGIFNNANPVFLEIGSGKGEFLSEYSHRHPEWNFIGFEVKAKRVNIVLRKLEIAKHSNVRVATFMIDDKITDIIPAQSVSGMFIQHPDPWPKRRHFKRRLVQQPFLDALSKITVQGGFIQVSTDHMEYAGWIWKEFDQREDFKPIGNKEISDKPLLDFHVETFFEREQRRLGFEAKHMLFEKI